MGSRLGLIVRWLVSPPSDDWSPSPPVTVADDVGTEYRHTSGGAFGHDTAVRRDAMFIPARPPTAAVLTISHGGESVDVNLRADLPER
jgi:hypothetical protein